MKRHRLVKARDDCNRRALVFSRTRRDDESSQPPFAPIVTLDWREISSAVSTALRTRNCAITGLSVRSGVDTAICSKPLARWMYGDWMSSVES